MIDDHITSMGYDVVITHDVDPVTALLDAVDLDVVDEDEAWDDTTYFAAQTRAGGSAACVGWSRSGDVAVVHSLAVAPAMRGSGLGAGIVAAAVTHLMDSSPVQSIGLATRSHRARRLFRSIGFTPCELSELPQPVANHDSVTSLGDDAMAMIRGYGVPRRGLDQTAFTLILNDTPDATLPLGSVFFFTQTGRVIEARYRGGPVVRGHLLGSIGGEELAFVWHQYLKAESFQSGSGTVELDVLPDGRRELRQLLESEESGQSLLMREV